MSQLLGLDAGVVFAHGAPVVGRKQAPTVGLALGSQGLALAQDPLEAVAVALGVVLGVLRHGLRRERPVGPLAGLAGRAAGVGYRSKLSTSRFQPSKHVGKQSSGAGGWRAGLGRGGAFGGWAAGGKLGGAVAQAVTSNGASSSSGRQPAGLVFGFTGYLLVFADPRLLDGAVVGLGLPGRLRGACAFGLRLRLVLGERELGAVQARGLDAGQQQRGQDGAKHQAGHGWPSQVARSLARRLVRPVQRLAGSRQSLPWKNTQRSNCSQASACWPALCRRTMVLRQTASAPTL